METEPNVKYSIDGSDDQNIFIPKPGFKPVCVILFEYQCFLMQGLYMIYLL